MKNQEQEQDKKMAKVSSDAVSREAIPAKPADLSEQELDQVAGGGFVTVTINEKTSVPAYTVKTTR